MESHQGTPGPTAEASPFHLTVQLFGSLLVRRGDTVLDARHLGGPKPRQILEILLLELGTPVSKDRLIERLWGDTAPAEALPTLESYVSVLRRNLQPGAGRTGPLQTATGGYLIDRAQVELDLDRFDTLVRRAQLSPPAESYLLLREALELASAPLLGDEMVPSWAEDERTRQDARTTAARVLAAEAAISLARAEEAVAWATAALAGEPLNERAWTALVLGLEQAGRPADGLRAYERCRRAMGAELGCSPGPGLRTAYLRLLHATADDDGELSDVLSALLVLHNQLTRAAAGADDLAATETQPVAASRITSALEEAGNVITSYLHRALTAA